LKNARSPIPSSRVKTGICGPHQDIRRHVSSEDRVDQQTYDLNRAKLLDEIKGSYMGFAKDDFPVPIDILESDLARVDSICQTFSSGDIEEWGISPQKKLQIKDVFGSDATDASMEFESGDEKMKSESDDESDHDFKIQRPDDDSDTAQNLERVIEYERAASEDESTSDLEGATIDAVTSASDEEDYEKD
jgi:hypothetical protein